VTKEIFGRLKMKKGFMLAAILLILVALLVGCSPSTTTPTASTKQATSATPVAPKTTAPPIGTALPAVTTAAPTSTVQTGGVLKILVSGSSTNFGNPIQMNTPTDNMYGAPAMEGLVKIDPNGNLAPWLATSWTISADGKSMTFTLRQGVKFHDGTEFNAQAAKQSLEMSKAGEWPQFKTVASFEALDNYTLKMTFSESFDWSIVGAMGRVLTGWIFSPTYLQTHDKTVTAFHPVGTGPFRFVSYQKDTAIKYEKNPEYWDKGKPYLDAMEFDMMADVNSGVLSYKSGAASVLYNLPAKYVNDLQKSGSQIIKVPASAIDIYPDSAKATSPFSNQKVREALDYAIDKKAIADALGYGFYEPAYQPFPAGYWAAAPDLVGHPYNPAKAKQLLAEAGYANGFKTTLTLQTGAAQDAPVAIQANLKDVGIDCAIVNVTLPAFSALSTKGWDGLCMASTGMPLPGLDPGTMLKSHPISLGAVIVSVKREPEIEDLFLKSNMEPDNNKRKAMLQQISKLMIDKYAQLCYIYSAPVLSAAQPQVHNLDIGINPWPNYGSAWLSK
jgi:peptide/nickel transport system substrate-binding protein